MQTPKAILFDLDDTLLLFEGASDTAWEKSCHAFIRDRSLQIPPPDLIRAVNRTRRWYWSDSSRHKSGRENLNAARREVATIALGAFDITDPELARELAGRYSLLQDSLVCLLPNTTDTLTELKANGYRLGLVTNGSSAGQRLKLDRFGLNAFFEIVLIDQEVGFSKPDARIFEHALKLLDLPARDVWMVGDNLIWDIRAPKEMGIHTVWYDSKKSGLPSDTSIFPDREIRDLSELLPGLRRNL